METQEDEVPPLVLPPIETWPIYSKVDVVRAYQTLQEVYVDLPIPPYKQHANPGDYIVVGFANVMRVVSKALFEKMYQPGEDVASPEKAMLLRK